MRAAKFRPSTLTVVELTCLLTPVPGGVGPMTIAVLLDQTLAAAQSHVRDAV
ncbi:MAG: hypothetical protein WB709_12900 [Solirubrobacteraceae bacterium]